MKKRMMILSVLLMAIFVAQFAFEVMPISESNHLMSHNATTTEERQNLEDMEETGLLPLSAATKNGMQVVDKVSGKEVTIWPTRGYVKSSTPLNENMVVNHPAVAIATIILALFAGILALMFFYNMIGFLVKIIKGKVFEIHTFKSLRNAALCNIVGAITTWVVVYLLNKCTFSGIDIAGYAFTSMFSVDEFTDGIADGVLMLIFAEAFLIGLKQKEELDLTV